MSLSSRTFSAGKRLPPFRIFFLLATGDAILLGGLWLIPAFSLDLLGFLSLGQWHRGFIFHGTPILVLAGFLLTALPRWTRQEAASVWSVRALALLWLAGRAASFLAPAAGLALAALFILSLTWIAAQRVWAAGDNRNHKVVLLLLALSVGGSLSALPSWQPLGTRIGIAAIVGLLIIIGGRVVPALSSSFAVDAGLQLRLERLPLLEHLVAATTAMALTLWALMPDLPLLSYLCLAAGAAQLARLGQWRGWRFAGTCSIVGLHVGYFWFAVGFLLLGIHLRLPEILTQSAAAHAWTIGAFGTLAIGIMSSMIRKHSDLAFSRSLPACLSLAAVMLAALMRLAAEVSPQWFPLLAPAAAILWILAFGLFLMAFGRRLFHEPRAAAGI